MNDAVIIAVANAITAQAETIKALIDALPKETKVAVDKKIAKATTTATPAASVEMTTEPVAATPVTQVIETVTAPVVNAVTAAAVVPATVTPVSVMPAPPFPAASVPAPIAPAPVSTPVAPVAPVSAPSSDAPFTEAKGMMKYVMDSYQALGQEKGARIQNVLSGMGVKNINDVTPAMYGALYAGVEALKA